MRKFLRGPSSDLMMTNFPKKISSDCRICGPPVRLINRETKLDNNRLTKMQP